MKAKLLFLVGLMLFCFGCTTFQLDTVKFSLCNGDSCAMDCEETDYGLYWGGPDQASCIYRCDSGLAGSFDTFRENRDDMFSECDLKGYVVDQLEIQAATEDCAGPSVFGDETEPKNPFEFSGYCPHPDGDV